MSVRNQTRKKNRLVKCVPSFKVIFIYLGRLVTPQGDSAAQGVEKIN